MSKAKSKRLKPVTVTLTGAEAVKLARLLVCHVSFCDFPVTEKVYESIKAALQDQDTQADDLERLCFWDSYPSLDGMFLSRSDARELRRTAGR